VITEVAGNNEDIYYDVSAYTVIVTVAVDGEKLVATYELSKDGEAYEGDIEFHNVVLTEIEDEDPPEHDSPDTGDNIGIFMMLGALSVTAFFTMNIFEKSRRKTN
jgi:pilin isopeptide linkage protein